MLETIGEWLLNILGIFGLGLGGAQAAAAGELALLQQASLEEFLPTVLTPAELAAGVVKGHIGDGDGARWAAKSGLDAESFAKLVETTGNPPGPQELLELLRRGVIGAGDVERGMREGYLKNDWIPALMELRRQPLGIADAVQAAVQNHADYMTAVGWAGAHGIDAGDFRVLFENAGNPPGPMELLNLWVRGYISEADVDQGLRESRLKDKWIEPLKNLSHHKVPMRTITTLLSHGAIDAGRAMGMLRELGFSEGDAQAIIDSAHKAATTPHRELSVSTIRGLYVDRLISREAAAGDLVTAGYKPEAAAVVLDLADAEATHRYRASAIGKVRSIYVAHHSTANEASASLDALQVPADQRDQLIALWTLERDANVRELTPAQIVSAGKKGLIGPADVVARLVALGYQEADAVLLGMLGGAIPVTAGP